MVCGFQILARAIILVLFCLANFTVGVSIKSNMKDLAISENVWPRANDSHTASSGTLARSDQEQLSPPTATPAKKVIFTRDDFSISRSDAGKLNQAKNMEATANAQTTANKASSAYWLKTNIHEDAKRRDGYQHLAGSSVKYNSMYDKPGISNTIFPDSLNRRKFLNNAHASSTAHSYTRHNIAHGRLWNVRRSRPYKLSKRDTENRNILKSKDMRNLSNKTLFHYETSANVGLVPLIVVGANSSAPKADVKRTNVSDGVSRQQRQIPTTAVLTNNRNIRAREEGDAIIGALFPLHRTPPQTTAYTRQCGEIWETYGIQRVEAFLMTIESINRNTSILPNIKLGWDIRDSCWYSPIALENSIDFIKDAIASQSKVSNNDSSATPSRSTSDTASVSSSSGAVLSSARESDTTVTCAGNKNLKPIIGLVGPGSSESTIQVQNLLQIFNIPQIGYSATSIDLSDKNHYRYFLRVVPSDLYQAQVLVDILLTFNWTYISTVHSDGNYGLKGMTEFTEVAKSKGICIAVTDNIASTAEDAAFDKVLMHLIEEDPNASVVVCFCEGMTVRNLFSATRRRKMDRRLLIIGSDGWNNRQDVVKGLEVEAAGAISVKLYSPTFKDFIPHYEKLRPHGSPKNPWFNEFWEGRFNCSLDKNNLRRHPRVCVGNENLVVAEEDSKLGFVVNAVTAMALALHNMHQDVCPGSKGLCPAMEPLNGSMYLQYLLNVSFLSYSGEEVNFDSSGDPPPKYEILNYQSISNPNGSTTYDYVTIGRWISGHLTLNISNIYWPQLSHATKNESRGIIQSVCSEPCNWNEAKKVKGVACCWICTTCQENEILVANNTNCSPCDLGMWPNPNKTDCEEIPVDFIHWSDTQAIVGISLGSLGICVTLWVLVTFIRCHNTPVVKASTRELSYIILVGICLAFSANYFIVSKPAKEVCYLTRILPGLSFSLMYGALVTRTNRIARILEGSKRIMTKKPKFMSATAQVVISGIIIGIECAVITGMLVYQPADSRLDYSTTKKVRLICDTSTLGIVVPLGFDLVLIFLCTIYAVKTRNLPENFNEAKFIGFTMYSTCVIWLGFFPIYFAGDNKEITFSICVSLSAAIALVLLFLPKVYVILWVPEKNTRGAFTTSRDVRCHIGSKSMTSGDSIDIKESSTYESLFKSEKGHGRHWRQKSLDEKRLRFVIQRAGGAEDETPYINHGVIPNHTNLKSTTFVDRVSKNSCKTDSTTVSTESCPEKERLFPKESREITSVEIIRQNLARDFPLHKPQVIIRPGSPAEREKHRIHNVDHIVDLDDLLGIEAIDVHGRLGRHGEFRKSLSSTCVSTYPKSVNAHCQTTDDLVDNLLPPLRRRHVSRNKKKLERSEAIEDFAGLGSWLRKEVHDFKQPNKNHTKSLAIQRMQKSLPTSELSETLPVMVCHNCGHQDFLFSPEMSTNKSSLLDTYYEDQMHRRHSHHIPRADCHPHHIDILRRCSNGFEHPSPVLPLSAAHFHQTFKPKICASCKDCNSVKEVKNVEDQDNALSSVQLGTFSSHLPRNLPEPGLSSSAKAANESHWCQGNDISTTSLTQQDSFCSTPASIASSSSFTLPPFRTSTDSNPSIETFDDSYNSLELEYTDSAQNIVTAYNDGNKLTDTQQNRAAHLRGDYVLQSNGKNSEVSVVPLQSGDEEKDDVLEFQRYLQVRGIQLELCTAQSSDL